MRIRLSTISSIAPALAIAIFGLVVAPKNAHAQDPEQLYACVNNNSGEVKFVGADDTCPRNSTKVNWSVEQANEPGTLSHHSVHERTLDTGTTIASGIFAGLQCPAGKKPLGGGVEIVPALAGYGIVATRPLRPGDFSIPDPQGWFIFVLKLDAAAPFVPIIAKMYVTCAAVD